MMENKNTDSPLSGFTIDSIIEELKHRIDEIERRKNAPKLFVARWKDNSLHLYTKLPARINSDGYSDGKFGCVASVQLTEPDEYERRKFIDDSCQIDLPSEFLPEVTWECSPMVLVAETFSIY
jgi:hypothetical protein